MTAKDAISTHTYATLPEAAVSAATPLMETLPALLEAPGHTLRVDDGSATPGIITEASMLEALGRMIVPRDDSSVVTVECAPADYAASTLASAVEDADAHLVDLFSGPSANGNIRITLRVRTLDPGDVIQSLERYGYTVVEAGSHDNPASSVLSERIAALQVLLNV